MNGPGKYDEALTAARAVLGEEVSAVLIVLNGPLGPGMACQTRPGMLASLPSVLETVAARIRTIQGKVLEHQPVVRSAPLDPEP